MTKTMCFLKIIFSIVLGLVSLMTALPTLAEWYSREEAIMGTAVRVELWHDDATAARVAMSAVMDEMHRIDALMSPYKPDSELSRINREAAQKPVVISREMFDLIARSIEFSKLSGGAFDITFSSVGYLYDYREHVKPTDRQIAQALPGINYRHLQLDSKGRTIHYARPGLRIDLGGIAKGYAVDNCIAILKGRGITNAIVTAGGDSRLLGDRRGRPWNVGIRDPRRSGEVAAVLPLADIAISTSGDYERYFEEDGVRHHHIINPRTGKSATGVRSVTVIGPDGITTEGLTKSVFVKGPKAGMRLIESLKGVDAVIIDDAGRMLVSPGLRNAVRAAPLPATLNNGAAH
ncbi:MAG TPA: FAD:protein FMN transferase [Acidiferrobacterales bacterium]|nr:FAD:protein FMN transferase [Acidiferrobacterales bacterium]